MKELLHSSNQLYPILIVGTLLIFGLVACHTSKENKLLLNPQTCSSVELSQQATDRFIQSLRRSDFLPQSPKIILASESDFSGLKQPSDSEYIPAALWKLYALDGKEEWKQLAVKYTHELEEKEVLEKTADSSALLHVYLARYSTIRGSKYRKSLLHALSTALAREESNVDPIDRPNNTEHVQLGKLLDNELLFFASQETGDPIYSQVAKQNSDAVFDYFFLNSKSEQSYAELLNEKKNGLDEVLRKLSSKDFYTLSLIFYGFTILNEEENNERYHSLCKRLARLFADLFRETDTELSSVKNYRSMLEQKVEVLPRIWIALALKNLNSYSGNYYKEISAQIICQTMDGYAKFDQAKANRLSPRLYYYLFTYFNHSENL